MNQYAMPRFKGRGCEKCARLKAWDSDGKANEQGMALYFLEKLIEEEKKRKAAERRNTRLLQMLEDEGIST